MLRSAAEIPITAPVWALLQFHHWNAMPKAMKAWMRAWVAADSCLTHFTIWLKTVSTVRSTRSTLLRTDRSTEAGRALCRALAGTIRPQEFGGVAFGIAGALWCQC